MGVSVGVSVGVGVGVGVPLVVGGKKEYAQFSEGAPPPEDPRLFQICDAAAGGSGVVCEEVFNFCQDDLVDEAGRVGGRGLAPIVRSSSPRVLKPTYSTLLLYVDPWLSKADGFNY